MTLPTRTIAIVGGGFSGTTVAINLLRQLRLSEGSCGSARIALIERASRIGRGIAYADRKHRYLLNVPAGRMSANAREPLEFLAYARNRFPNATPDDFLPRSLYGEYLEASLLTAELSAPADIRLDRVRAEISAVERIEGSASFRLQFSDGRLLVADEVILALGHPDPATLPAFRGLRESALDLADPRYFDDPWAGVASCRPGETVLIVGTGLTMADVATAAATATDGDIEIYALSRHGLLPPTQTAFRHSPCHGDTNRLLNAASRSARELMSVVRELAANTEAQGGDWREAITFVRNIAPAIWDHLPSEERRRFLRHARTYWDIHRHRLPQETLSQIEALRERGKLTIDAGRILSASVGRQQRGTTDGDSKIQVTYRSRGGKPATLLVDRVINCTGPDYNPRRSLEPLVRSLLSQRLASPDELNLGFRTGAHGALIDSRDREVPHLYYVGPQLRADYWEATAAQELRSHAERLARHLTTPRVSRGLSYAGGKNHAFCRRKRS
ncbi:MAG TPA: FAD/NAD(P)-binding protein [Steroidobacteraceae bacterium]